MYSEIALLLLAQVHMTRGEALLALLKLFLNESPCRELTEGKKGEG